MNGLGGTAMWNLLGTSQADSAFVAKPDSLPVKGAVAESVAPPAEKHEPVAAKPKLPVLTLKQRAGEEAPVDTAGCVKADSVIAVPLMEAGVVPDEFKTDTLRPYCEALYVPGDTANVLPLTAVVGKEADPIPYQLYSDNVLTSCIFLSFFLLSYVLANGKRYLAQQVKNLFYVRERASLFAVETGSDIRYRLLLIGQTCLILGIFFFDYSHDFFPNLFTLYPSMLLLGCYVGIVVVYYVLKMLAYTWMNWIFFDKQKNSLWLESYSLIYSLLGILLFPLLLLVVYFDLSNLNSFIFFIILGVFAEIMLFYKCFNIFFSKMYGFLYFIVYFCALEMVPCFLLWQALITTNDLLIIKN